MRFRRPLLLVELDRDAAPTLAFMRAALADVDVLRIIATTPSPRFAWLFGAALRDPRESVDGAVDALRVAARSVAPEVSLELVSHLSDGLLAELAEAHAADLFVVGPHPDAVGVTAEFRRRAQTAILCVPDALEPARCHPPRELVCVALGDGGRPAMATFLRDHSDATQHASVLLPPGVAAPSEEEVREIAGVEARVTFVTPDQRSARRWLQEELPKTPIDLVVFARFPMDLLLSAALPLPTLLLPPADVARSALSGRIDGPDLLDDGGPLRTLFEYALGLGRRSPILDQEVAFISHGEVLAVVRTRDGRAELPPLDPAATVTSLGVLRREGVEHVDPLLAVELRVAVLRPGTRPLVLYDAELGDGSLAALTPLAEGYDFVAVRLRPTRSAESIRERARAAALPQRVVDASLVLNEGAAHDVSESLDNVRLARVGARLRGAGFPVAAVVIREGARPSTLGFGAYRANELAPHLRGATWADADPDVRPSRLEATTGAARVGSNAIEVELDNRKAREWLVDAIRASSERVHLQVYMADDDEVGRAVESALTEAAARGVTVRVLVDSLHALHESLGVENPLLARLGACPGVELRAWRPIRGVPSLADIKQRDHRKLVVVDGELALLGGRNLSREYYTDFAEVPLTAASTWRDVPWLDAGARVRGPAVVELERSFSDAWTSAGGEPFELRDVAPAGPTAARVVVHRGLRDAHTLEAYLALIAGARERLTVVNGFPLLLEIQHALLEALGRGVAVRALFGHLTPSHGGAPFEGPWVSARAAATELVHSRMDALIAAGAEAYQFAVPPQPTWDPAIGPVRSHVHAKLLCVDGRVCALGSANLDITAGYWESELLLVVEDVAVTASVETDLQRILDGSERVVAEDPVWQELARRREWMRRWPGLLSL
ncbi:MAG: phosphatidylserine/phosphatidylglycerophosphate/cardiolipin synthase family protein [Polyangiales bacterium]